ncbi:MULTISPECIES: photosystem I reaction center protein subunit XI [Leptolyngbya]|jgi:photosystem I subunit 11|uniref:Photosystem I reaction center subunit XI n=2 Tax=Leptolyngbya boryana TaxID=1184 RepID=A0A1Z4JNP7_LEPBY|nr:MULTISPECIES: photosystem I reaction center protein subunit XI [Leptolyngbya]BAY58395.1 photosystem I reaction center protein subunit XI [Leptolyngbya boryana NIES-2135]MBD1858932.1 photosystem I reaction center protein subunit XI [Leptolyngbya sp. FACHB-1624]MBD2368069.1 photosystem I reaction center protein subunit XI [Leptolyngbya sp. FACHB-161]MBD2374593.1 photosystem I reaction center protein subunit XI [Leptolyngbya sp. FACHB-238]MBD2399015.1 photosystem I reaction center protein subu
MADELIKPYNGDPFTGHLSTPISDSGFTRAFIGNLPAYRKGLSPLLRGLEIGMAHGYFLVGPWTLLGPLRDSDHAAVGGLISAIALILIATACLSTYGLATFQGDNDSATDSLQTSEGWSQFAGGFFVGATGGAAVAFLLLSNFPIIDKIFTGAFN